MSKKQAFTSALGIFFVVFAVGLAIYLANSKEFTVGSSLFLVACGAVPGIVFYLVASSKGRKIEHR